MQRTFIQLPPFTRYLDDFINRGKILKEDFEEFEDELLNNPSIGEVIPGLSGLRKTRLKGAHVGKRGGFRVDYLDIPEVGKIYLIVLYPKNEKTDLTSEEKKIVLRLVKQLKEEATRE
jgi:hypothetical protein